ncbi:MAG: hypothetical protein KAJ24_03085 [Candidatus Aenigmarchaeota archaeon]|nr:hypothetical protein [Candidatus Aenigmarchaeota archaeon]
MPTTTELTEKYLSEHPSIRDCLKNEVINYSRLSRKIALELGIEKKSSHEAILIACRRYAMKLKKEKALEDKILRILKKSELEIKNKIVVAILSKKCYMEHMLEIEKKVRKNAETFYLIEGKNAYTIIISEKYLEDAQRLFGKSILKLSKNLAIITLKSPEDMEKTPGVTAYIYSLFGERGINIVETMSCWTDTILVVSEKDIANIMGFLRF